MKARDTDSYSKKYPNIVIPLLVLGIPILVDSHTSPDTKNFSMRYVISIAMQILNQ